MEMRAAIDVAGERAFAADVDAVRRLAVAAHLTEHDDLAGRDVRRYLAVTADRDAVAGEIDGTFDLAVDVQRFGAGDFALDDETLADGGLVRIGGRAAGGGSRGASKGRGGRWGGARGFG